MCWIRTVCYPGSASVFNVGDLYSPPPWPSLPPRYMMSKFAVCARSAHDQESWIRSIPMLVLMFEGITGGVLDFDYAPASMLITIDGKSRRVWMNVTQEGKAAIDDLREKGLVNGLKLSTEDFQPVTAYQVSRKGLNLVGSCPEEIKAMVDKFLYPPPPAPQAQRSTTN